MISSGGCFFFYRKFLRIPYKRKNNYCTVAEKKYAAKAARRRRRILQSRILCFYIGNFVPYIKTLWADTHSRETEQCIQQKQCHETNVLIVMVM